MSWKSHHLGNKFLSSQKRKVQIDILLSKYARHQFKQAHCIFTFSRLAYLSHSDQNDWSCHQWPSWLNSIFRAGKYLIFVRIWYFNLELHRFMIFGIFFSFPKLPVHSPAREWEMILRLQQTQKSVGRMHEYWEHIWPKDMYLTVAFSLFFPAFVFPSRFYFAQYLTAEIQLYKNRTELSFWESSY